MRFLFYDEAFSFETLRTSGFGVCGWADFGEIVTTPRIDSSPENHQGEDHGHRKA